MLRGIAAEGTRRKMEATYTTPEVNRILQKVAAEVGDDQLASSIRVSPTALTQIKRLLNYGGTIITDTTMISAGLNERLLSGSGARVATFINDPGVVQLAEQRRATRAEIAVDMGLAVPGIKLMVIGSAPAAINRLLVRRQYEPMNDVCVLAAPTGFASVVQLKERLCDSPISSIVVRGKKGGINVTVALLNAILSEIEIAKIG